MANQQVSKLKSVMDECNQGSQLQDSILILSHENIDWKDSDRNGVSHMP